MGNFIGKWVTGEDLRACLMTLDIADLRDRVFVQLLQDRLASGQANAERRAQRALERQPPHCDLYARITLLESENRRLCAQLTAGAQSMIDLERRSPGDQLAHHFAVTEAGEVIEPGDIDPDDNDEHVLQDVGIDRYHHPLDNAVAYQARLAELSARIAKMVKADAAIQKWTLLMMNGSVVTGRALMKALAQLMLRAYNAEAENLIYTLRAGNSVTAVRRLHVARTSIEKLGTLIGRISDEYHALRIQEIELTTDYLMKKEEEKEAARAERERLREERAVQKELAAARERLEKEREHLFTVIQTLAISGATDPELESKLAQVDSAIAQNDYRAANIRAGYVYVISNRGAFGERLVKIGLTRRLVPMERIYELGDASVPFRFDVHAIYFAEDAVTLESELHAHFAAHRVNWVNRRREFFFASPADVRSVLMEKVGNLLEFAEHAESAEYLESIRYWPSDLRPQQFHEDAHRLD
jgi:hypothetical protein